MTIPTSNDPSCTERVCAVIVSFHPEAVLLENVLALRSQVGELLIVDNASGPASADLLQQCVAAGANLISLPENVGIAAALNVAVKHARTGQYDWLATFDQDSRATLDMISNMLAIHCRIPHPEQVAGLSPRYRNPQSGDVITSEVSHSDSPDLWVEVFVVLTSGNLIKLSTFEKVGLFNEALFIDHVDTEFCLRCNAANLKTMEIKTAYLLHCIGQPAPVKVFGRLKHVSNHSALRRYYLTRNSLYIYHQFFSRFPLWTSSNFIELLRVLAMVWFEPETGRKLYAIWRGVLDALQGKMGKCPHSL